MNKGQLIDSVSNDTGLKKSEISKALDSILDNVQGALQSGSDVSLVGFGTWKKNKSSKIREKSSDWCNNSDPS